MGQDAKVRFRATVHYDGSLFAGWQLQPQVRTVQGELESALEGLFGGRVRVAAAGRTDAGVHAAGQEIAFDAPARWVPHSVCRALNAVLPDEVWVETVRSAERGFHPRFQATGRRYEYYVGTDHGSRSPLRAGRVWRLGKTPDEGLLREAADQTIGERDFRALSRAGQPRGGKRCSVELAEWARTGLGDLRFMIVADRFLHRMVRYLVATMVGVGTGQRTVDEYLALLAGSHDVRPPRPAPSEGLYLSGVRYADGWNREPGVPGLWPTFDSSRAGA